MVLAGVLGFVGVQRMADSGPGAAASPAAVGVAALAVMTWGLGVALGFPVAMSAAADDPSRAAARVSVVASIGYVAFLAGPPLLGLLADHVGVVTAMLAVSVAVALSLLGSGAARPPREHSTAPQGPAAPDHATTQGQRAVEADGEH
jgi:MFS family permease